LSLHYQWLTNDANRAAVQHVKLGDISDAAHPTDEPLAASADRKLLARGRFHNQSVAYDVTCEVTNTALLS
jgi:hypothetical protein